MAYFQKKDNKYIRRSRKKKYSNNNPAVSFIWFVLIFITVVSFIIVVFEIVK
jgi:t-SNARE complex subunit (syntaxin)